MTPVYTILTITLLDRKYCLWRGKEDSHHVEASASLPRCHILDTSYYTSCPPEGIIPFPAAVGPQSELH